MKRTHKMAFRVFFLSVFMLVKLASCDFSYLEIKELPEINYQPVFAVPLVNSSLGVSDMIPEKEQGLVRTGSDKLLSLVYKNNLLSATGAMLYNLPSQMYPANFAASPPTQGTVPAITRTFSFSTGNNDRLDSLKFQTGQMQVFLSVPNLAANGYQAMVTITIPGSYNSQRQVFTMQVPANGNATANLEGFTIPFYSSGTTHNLFDVRYQVTFSGAGTPTNAPYTFNFNQTFAGLSLNKMVGVLAQRSLFLGGIDINLGLFSSSIAGNITLEDPKLRINAKNSFGTPLRITANNLRFSHSGNQVAVTGFPSPWSIPAPAINQMGQTITTSVVLNRQNSNVHEAVAIKPVNLHASFTSILNPGGTLKAFVAHDSQLDMEVEIELPLWGGVGGFTLQETIDLGRNDSITEVEWLELRLEFANHFPVDLNMQIEFADSNMVVKSKLWENVSDFNIVGAAQVDAQGNVTAPQRKVSTVMLNQQQVLAFLNSRNLIIKARLNTTNSGLTPVKIFSDQKLDVRIGARMKGKIII